MKRRYRGSMFAGGRKYTAIVPVLIWLGIFFFLISPAMAVYEADVDFGDGGRQVIGIGNFNDRGLAAVLQSDGKIIVAGTSENEADSDAALIRLNSDGSLDTSFNSDGKLALKLGSENDGASGVAVLNDGSIVIAGYSETSGEKRFALSKVTADGVLEIAFGGGGTGNAILEDGTAGEALSVIQDSQNRILVAGRLQPSGEQAMAVARYLADGSLDTDFGTDGYTLLGRGNEATANFIVEQSNGKIVVGGTKTVDSKTTATLFRLDGSGIKDSGYGDDGEGVTTDLPAPSSFYDAVVLPDNSLVAVGSTTAEGREVMAAVKFNSSGLMDSSFGTGGVAQIKSSVTGRAYGIARRQDNSFVITGRIEGGSGDDVTLAHLAAGGAGLLSELVEVDVAGGADSGRALLASPGSWVVVAGFSSNGVEDDIAVLAFAEENVELELGAFGSALTADDPYGIETVPVTDISRNGAVTGGVISENSLFVCEEEEADEESEENGDETGGEETAEEGCRPKVTERGVVFSVSPNPVTEETDGDEEAQDGDSDAEETTGESDTSDEDDASDDESANDSSVFGDGSGAGESAVFPEWLKDSSHNYTLVKEGETSDGSGTGSYESIISGITPEVVYYVRAYAVLDDGTVIYGNQHRFETDAACFIATAAYGSALQPHVRVLSLFRDRYLKTNWPGRQFVRLYYHFSPPLAEAIGQSSILRQIVRILLLPLVGLGYFMVYLPLYMKAGVLLCMGGIYLYYKRFFRKESMLLQ